MSYIAFKNKFKKIKILYTINTLLKAKRTKESYNNLKNYYEKISANNQNSHKENAVTEFIHVLFKKKGLVLKHIPKGKLKILYITADPEQDFGGLIQGLQKYGEVTVFEQYTSFSEQMFSKKNGISLAKFNGNRLMELINNILTHNQIHIVIGQMWGWTIDYNILQKIRILGIPVVNISMDDRHAFQLKKNSGKWLGTSGLIGAIDLACTAAKECCLWYQVEGCLAIYLPEASDPELYKPFAVSKEYDICFVGANYGIRSKIVKAIEEKGIRVTSYGNGWPNGRIDIKKIPEIFAKSRIILGIGTIGHCTDFYSLKMRDFDAPMSGSFYLTHDNPDLYELYDIGREIATYRTPEECANKVSYYLSHHSERESIAMAGRERAMKDHTWEKRFDKVLRTIGILNKEDH